MKKKYGIEYEEFTNPWHAAASSFIAFVLGSLPPMLSITIFPSDYRIPATVFIVVISLLITGYTSAKLGKAPTKTAMIRNLCIGLLTMGVTYLWVSCLVFKKDTSRYLFLLSKHKQLSKTTKTNLYHHRLVQPL